MIEQEDRDELRENKEQQGIKETEQEKIDREKKEDEDDLLYDEVII